MAREKEMEMRREGRPHAVTIEMCRRAVISGVEELGSFHEQQITVVTSCGLLSIEGEGLHIDRLNLDDGQLIVTGLIFGALYSEANEGTGGGFFSRLMRR